MTGANLRRLRLGIALGMLLSLSGCSVSYPVVLRGVVRAFGSGTPLAGVRVELKPEPDGPRIDPASTASDGAFEVRYRMGAVYFGPGATPWSVTFAKEGYRTDVVDLGTIDEPTSSGSPVTIVVAAILRESP